VVRKRPTVLFDTNFLLIPSRFGVDIFEESERALNLKPDFVVIKGVLDEIQLLKEEAQPSFRKQLELAEKLAERCTIIDYEWREDEEVDDTIVRVSMSNGYIVGTTDAELRKRLHDQGVKVLFLRQKSFIMLE
jgi:rRNA-processing protein FCF1